MTQTAALFDVPQDGTIGRWLKKYESHGLAAFLKETRGRKRLVMTKKSKGQTKILATNLKGQELTFTRHSLGGGTASLNALVTGYPAITFNVAGLGYIT